MRCFLTVTCLVLPALAPRAWAAQGGACPQLGATLCVPLDSSFTVVPFNAATCGRNDDEFAALALNGWSFDLYGALQTSLFVNNNGNLSFGQGFPTFTASGFPVAGFPMIAPFWADVDTRALASGAVWYREWATTAGDAVNRLVVTWDQVGYFNEQTDKHNTFQVILTDGNDPLIGLGNNVGFCYDDMQWTTGSASGGVGGFGGTAATVGANSGNGIDFFQIGRFDHEGIDYDGPGGANDGVSFLDNSTFSFSTALAPANTAPIFLSPPSTLMVALGQQLAIGIEAIGPEIGETVDLSVETFGLANFTFNVVPGNPARLDFTYAPTALASVGNHIVRITATDDGTPPLQTVLQVSIDVFNTGTGDQLAPECIVTSQTPSRVDGIARDNRPLDSGIASVTLAASSANLSLYVGSFAAGAPSVTWSLGRMNSLEPGAGTIVVLDVAGNSTELAVDVAPAGDCNGNGVPDSMDLLAQTSNDWNANGLPDECEQVGFVYCASPQHNSTGRPAFMIVTGSNRIQDNSLVATAYNAVPFSFGFFAVSQTSDFVSGQTTGFSYGNICLGTPIGGFRNGLIRIDSQGQFSRIADLSSFPTGGGPLSLMPGTTVFIQGWYRDQGTYIRNNLTDALEILFH